MSCAVFVKYFMIILGLSVDVIDNVNPCFCATSPPTSFFKCATRGKEASASFGCSIFVSLPKY